MNKEKAYFSAIMEKVGIDSAIQWLLLERMGYTWDSKVVKMGYDEPNIESSFELAISKPWNLTIYSLSKEEAIAYFIDDLQGRKEEEKLKPSTSTALTAGFTALYYISSRLRTPLDTKETIQEYANRLYDTFTYYNNLTYNIVSQLAHGIITFNQAETQIKKALDRLNNLVY